MYHIVDIFGSVFRNFVDPDPHMYSKYKILRHKVYRYCTVIYKWQCHGLLVLTAATLAVTTNKECANSAFRKENQGKPSRQKTGSHRPKFERMLQLHLESWPS